MRAFTILATALGLALFGVFVWQTGPLAIGSAVLALGGWGLVVPLPQLFSYALDTLGWKYSFAGRAVRLRFGTLYLLRLAGESINYLTPTAYVGGEPVKAYLARRRGVDGVDAASSVVVAKTLMTLAEILFLVLGAAAALQVLPPGHPLFGGVALVVAVGCVVVGLLLWLPQRGMFAALVAALRRVGLGGEAVEKRAAALLELDRTVARFYREERRRFVAAVFWHLAGWVSGAIEVYLVTRWLGAPVTIYDAIAIEAFVAFVKGVFFFTPGSIGFQESGIVVLFPLFGFQAEVGAAYALVRRARELGLAGVGMFWLLREVSSLARLRRESAEMVASATGGERTLASGASR